MLFFRELAWKPRRWEREKREEDKKEKKNLYTPPKCTNITPQ
jgi:hypothetical protein